MDPPSAVIRRRPVPAPARPAGSSHEARRLAQHLQRAREDERARLARNLHDELGSLLTSARLDAAGLRTRLALAPADTQARLAHLADTLDRVNALAHRITEDLRPSALEHLGLVATLEHAAGDFATCSGIEVRRTLSPVHLSASAQLVVYRFVQEAFNNIAKHAHARHAWVRLAERGGRVEASVGDDGAGFDVHGVGPSAYGLLGMRFRAEAENGSLTMQTAPGQGTVLRVTLPQGG